MTKISSDPTWRPVQRNVKIPFNLESTHLQIKTDSHAETGETIDLLLYDNDGGYIDQLEISFFVLGDIRYQIG